MENKDIIRKIATSNIKRDGINELLDMLDKTDFYTAPASTRFHDSCKGGLAQHSMNVYAQLLDDEKLVDEFGYETLTIVALFHDICKIGFYKEDIRNTKDENGKWIQVPYYSIDDKMPLGHGEKSVIMLQEFIKLSSHEMLAINAHMGGFDKREYIIGTTFETCPLAVYLHIADLKASYLNL